MAQLGARYRASLSPLMAHCVYPGVDREGRYRRVTGPARTRRYLTGREVEKLIEAARKHGRYGHRDATMILLAYRHGLRASGLKTSGAIRHGLRQRRPSLRRKFITLLCY
jgi:integrase